jgi:hypothetical protein
MSEPSRSRWLDSDGSWQQGPPPVGYWQEGSGLWFPPGLLHHPAARPVQSVVAGEVIGLDDPPLPLFPPLPSGSSAVPGVSGPSGPSGSVAASYPPWLRLAVLTTLAATVLTLLAATHQGF